MKIMFDNTSGRNGTLEKWLVKKKKKFQSSKTEAIKVKVFCFVLFSHAHVFFLSCYTVNIHSLVYILCEIWRLKIPYI